MENTMEDWEDVPIPPIGDAALPPDLPGHMAADAPEDEDPAEHIGDLVPDPYATAGDGA
jgi:hypothetical protein